MSNVPEVILTGFADEGPVSKRAEEQLTLLAALGLQYYSIRFVDVGQGVKNVMKLTSQEVERLNQLHREFGIRVSSLGSPIGKVKLEDVEDGTSNRFVPFDRYLKEDVARAIEIAHALGTKLIRGFSFYPPKGSDPSRYRDRSVERIGAIAEACRREGVIFGLEVEANLVGHDGESMAVIYDRVASPNLFLIFDAANILVQKGSRAETVASYHRMKHGLGWMHIKDYRADASLEWKGCVDEEMLKNFVPADQGDSGHSEILGDFRERIPGILQKMADFGVPGVFLDLEPHLKGGGQFGGFSGPDGFGVALRGLLRVLDHAGIRYKLTDYGEIERAKTGVVTS
ncbi:MAG: sugar phosphate isomerase/epimerase [Planctomycetes bacterium]|nr:sugar phosphate isomerase/epimerase [Planctomycetota bacterium]